MICHGAQDDFAPDGSALLVPRLAKSDKLPLQATYHDSNVYDGCHASFDKLASGGFPWSSGYSNTG